MMTELMTVAVVWGWVWLMGWVLLRQYPLSAVDVARDRLFLLRGELFEMARAGSIGFDSSGYRAARRSLNTMIRYAHHASLLQVIVSSLVHNDAASKTWRNEIEAEEERSIAAIDDPKARDEIKRLLDEATNEVANLVVLRSIPTMVVAGVVMVLWFLVMLAKKMLSLAGIVRMNAAATAVNNVALANDVETIYEEHLRPVVRREAFRYVHKNGGSDEVFCEQLCAAA